MRNQLINPVVRALARTRAHRLLGRHIVVLRYTGRRTGRRYELPVMSAEAGEDLVVVSGRHETKTWWRNFGATPQEVEVRSRGRLERRSARRVRPGEPGYTEALAAYRRQFRHVDVDDDSPVLVLTGPVPATAEPPRPAPHREA